MRKTVFPKPLYQLIPTLPMTSTGPSQDAGKATLDLQVMATIVSHIAGHIARGTDHLALALLRCIQQVTRRSKEECGHKQISHSKCVGRFQIQGFHIELSMGVLRNCKLHSAKCRTTMTFQDHMWKLPWKKNIVHNNDYLRCTCCKF